MTLSPKMDFLLYQTPRHFMARCRVRKCHEITNQLLHPLLHLHPYIYLHLYTRQFKHNLYTTFHYHTHQYTLHTNIKTNTLHYKQTLYTINLHIKYTLDKYTIHFTYTLFILTIKHTLYSLNIIDTLLFHYYTHQYTLHSNIKNKHFTF